MVSRTSVRNRIKSLFARLPRGRTAVIPLGGFLEIPIAAVKQFVSQKLYAQHKYSRSVRVALRGVFEELETRRGIGIDVGSGGKQQHPRLLRVDRYPEGRIECTATAESLPFRDNSLDVVVTQEVIEHLANPWKALAEITRVLKPGGLCYVQAPFVIGYHSGPHDYWRFTSEGLQTLIEQSGLELTRIEPTVGSAVGMYRIAVEFAGVMAASISERLYLPVKGLAAVVCLPLCVLEGFALASPQAHRMPGGYLALARKRS